MFFSVSTRQWASLGTTGYQHFKSGKGEPAPGSRSGHGMTHCYTKAAPPHCIHTAYQVLSLNVRNFYAFEFCPHTVRSVDDVYRASNDELIGTKIPMKGEVVPTNSISYGQNQESQLVLPWSAMGGAQ